MEQSKDSHTMRSKNRSNGFYNSPRKSFYHDSWEELAFAEDAAGSLWPPRSYTCSFCRREFRSAQALGGHMNVHRRDRAKLKQGEDIDQNRHGQNINRFAISSYETSEGSCTLVFSPTPDLDDPCINFSSPSSTSRVSVLARKENTCQERSLFPSFSSFPAIQEHAKSFVKIPSISSCSISPGDKYYKISTVPKIEGDKYERKKEYGSKVDLVNTDLSVSFNLVTRRNFFNGSSDEEDQIGTLCKKQRTDDQPTEPSMSKPSSSCKNDLNSIEDLDLELRLGADPPKVK